MSSSVHRPRATREKIRAFPQPRGSAISAASGARPGPPPSSSPKIPLRTRPFASLSRPAQESPCCTMPSLMKLAKAKRVKRRRPAAAPSSAYPEHTRCKRNRRSVPHRPQTRCPKWRQHLRSAGTGRSFTVAFCGKLATDRRRAARAAGASGRFAPASASPPGAAAVGSTPGSNPRLPSRMTWDERSFPTLTEVTSGSRAKSPMSTPVARDGHIDPAPWSSWKAGRGLQTHRGPAHRVVRSFRGHAVAPHGSARHGTDTVLLYGHLDKATRRWSAGPRHGPWTPVRRGDKLYGARPVGDERLRPPSPRSLPSRRPGAALRGNARFASCSSKRARKRSHDFLLRRRASRQARHAEPVVCPRTRAAATTTSSGHHLPPPGSSAGVLTVEVDGGCALAARRAASCPRAPHPPPAARSIEDSRTGENPPARLPTRHPARARRRGSAPSRHSSRHRDLRPSFPFPPGRQAGSTTRTSWSSNNAWRPRPRDPGAAWAPLPADGGNVLRPKDRAQDLAAIAPTCDGRERGKAAQGNPRSRSAYGRPVTLDTYGEAGNG